MADASGRDLSQFMLWYTQAGTPELACSLDYDARSKQAKLSVNQIVPPTPGQARKEPMPIPLKLGLLGSNGDDLPLELADGTKRSDGLLEVTRARAELHLPQCPDTRRSPSLLRDFSAPVRLTISLDPDQIEFLMMHDRDPFNRWQAAQIYATNLLTAAARDGGNAEPSPARRQRGLRKRSARRPPMTRSPPPIAPSSCRLPSESDIARELAQEVDPDCGTHGLCDAPRHRSAARSSRPWRNL